MTRALRGLLLALVALTVSGCYRSTGSTEVGIKIGKPLEFGHLASDPPAKARRLIADEVMHAIADLSGQEYVHEYASDVKARLGG